MAKTATVNVDDLERIERVAGEAIPARVVSPDVDYGEPSVSEPNEELQADFDAQRAFEEEPEKPLQPYVLESYAFKSDMLKREAVLNNDIALLEGQRDGMNARIDDMHRTRVAVRAAIEVLK